MAVQSITTNLMVEDVNRSIDFWVGLLGFSVAECVDAEHKLYHGRMPGADLIWAMFVSGPAAVMVNRRDSLERELPLLTGRPTGGTLTLYVVVEDLEGLHRRIQSIVPTIKEPETSFYGMREWYVRDPDGYVVCLAQKVGED
ncbi:VOC family protein [Fundidesulfovibrio soli]|uniref:VOC family protein n=1 Tax=Fundidesulfovibrio soli TaxID=2922716 RepID=UPI001FB03850|nr:VOC family protein [Fundidesulfovibrio soli]